MIIENDRWDDVEAGAVLTVLPVSKLRTQDASEAKTRSTLSPKAKQANPASRKTARTEKSVGIKRWARHETPSKQYKRNAA